MKNINKNDCARAVSKIGRLGQDELHFMCKLVCLMKFCPGFQKDLDRLIPSDNEPISCKQLAAIRLLIEKWLYKEGYADLLRTELESVGVNA